MSWDPAVSRQEAIETACYRAIDAMVTQTKTGNSGQVVIDPMLMLIAGLEAIERARKKQQSGLSLPFTHQDVIDHLRLMDRICVQQRALERRRRKA